MTILAVAAPYEFAVRIDCFGAEKLVGQRIDRRCAYWVHDNVVLVCDFVASVANNTREKSERETFLMPIREPAP